MQVLWTKIQNRQINDWEPGKALEYLIVRALKLSDLDAEYPYKVPPVGQPFEQIDGVAYLGSLVFLVECKDTIRENLAVIAKIKTQLERRPPTVFGMIFITGTITLAALESATLANPLRIFIWQRQDIDNAISAKDFKIVLQHKYLKLCRYGLIDGSPFWRLLKQDGRIL